MGLSRVLAPLAEPLTLADTKAFLRVSIPDDDSVIVGLISAARAKVENYLGRRLVQQTWNLTLDTFPLYSSLNLPFPFYQLAAINSSNPFGVQSWNAPPNYGTLNIPNYEAQTLPNWGFIFFPFPPLVSINTVDYVDSATKANTLWAGSNYKVVTSSEPGYLKPLNQYPSVQSNTPEVVTIDFTCGYGAVDEHGNLSGIPDDILVAIKLMVGSWYEHREPGELPANTWNAVQNILDSYRFSGWY